MLSGKEISDKKEFITDYVKKNIGIEKSTEKKTEILRLAAEEIYEARKAVVSEHYQEALTLLNQAIIKNESDLDTRVLRASAIVQLGEIRHFPLACNDINLAIHARPDFASLYFTRAIIMDKLGIIKQVVKDCFTGFQLDTNNDITSLNLRFTILRLLLKFENINETLKSKDPLGDGNKKFTQGDYEAAIQFYNLGISNKSEDHYLYAKRGAANYKLKRYELAWKDYIIARWALTVFSTKKSSIIEPSIEYSLQIRNGYAEAGEFDFSMEEYNNLLEYEKKREPVEAKYKKLEKRYNRDFAEILLNKGKNYLADEDYEKSLKYLKKSFELNSEILDCHIMLATAYRRSRMDAEATRILRAALIKWPSDPGVLAQLKLTPKPPEPAKKVKKQLHKKPVQIIKPSEDELKASKARREEIKAKNIEKQQIQRSIIAATKEKEAAEKKEMEEFNKSQADEKAIVSKDKSKATTAKNKKKAKQKKAKKLKSQLVLQTETTDDDEDQTEKTPTPRHGEEKKQELKTDKTTSAQILTAVSVETPKPAPAKKPVMDDNKFPDLKELTPVERIPIRFEEFYILEKLEKSGINNKALIIGSTVRTRLFQKRKRGVSNPKIIFDTSKDLDVLTTASEQEILTALKDLGVQQSARKGLFRLTMLDSNGKEFKIDIWQTKYKTIKEDMQSRDFTQNALPTDKNGFVYDPTGRGLTDFDNNHLRTLDPEEKSFNDDASRILRGEIFSEIWGVVDNDKMQLAMNKCAAALPTMEDTSRIHSWLMKNFLYSKVSATDVKANAGIVERRNLIPKLFSDEYSKIFSKDQSFILTELCKRPTSLQEIYMIFYVSFAMNTDNFSPFKHKDIFFEKNRHVSDALEKYSRTEGFNILYKEIGERWLKHHQFTKPMPDFKQQAQTITPVAETLPARTIPSLSMSATR